MKPIRYKKSAALGKFESSQLLIKSFQAQANANRTLPEKIADVITAKSGSMAFLFLNVIWFSVWIVINLGWIPSIEPFDPFPFGLLTMVVSLEAIILAIVVLISQNRAGSIADVRGESDLQMDTITEHELTKLLQMVATLQEKQGIDTSKDEELQEMLKPIDIQKIESEMEKEME